MKKKLLLLFTILAIGLTNVWAYNFSAVAPSGQTLYYYISGGNAKVTYQNSSSQAYSNLTGALVIPASVTYYDGITYSVTSIGNDAFSDCSGLTSVTIPSSVTSIESEAFLGCSGLTSVTIGNSVTSIGRSAFIGCSGLTSVTIPSSVTSIGSAAFSGCSGLTSVTISNSVTSIGGSAFRNCSGLTSVTIPSSVTYIGDNAFEGCSGLTSVTIPSSVTSIGNYVFRDCSGLTSVTIPNSVTSIGNYAFLYCSGLTSVTIPSSVTSIGSNAFSGCSGLTSVEYTGDIAGWCSIDFGNYYANPNYYAHNLTIGGSPVAGTLVIPSGVSAIKNYAFYNCSGLTSLTIPNSVTTIGSQALYGVRLVSYCGSATGSPWGATRVGCFYEDGDFYYEDAQKTTIIVYIGAGTSVTIPSSVTSIGGGAFYNCSGLTNVVFNAQNCTTMGSSGYYGYESVFSGCSNFASLTIGDSVRTIPAYAFSGCSGLTSVTIPSSVTSIGADAFYGCSGLTNVVFNAQNCTTMSSGSNYYGYYSVFSGCSNFASLTIGDSVRTIPAYAFSGCSALTNVTIGNSVTSIGDYAFYGCSGLTSVTIPSSVTSIGNCAFRNCSGLTNVVFNAQNCTTMGSSSDYSVFSGCSNFASLTIGDSVRTIPAYAFSGCSGLTSVTIPSSVTSIGEAAFRNCSGLTSVTIPSSVTSIGELAFFYCSGLTSVTIPSSVTSIGEAAFYYCSGLTSVTIPNSVTHIGGSAFEGCSGLTSVTIPNSVTSIGDYAFYGCSGLTSVTIPSSVTSIESGTFGGCSGLTSVTIPSSVTSIGGSAFSGCSGLTSVTIPSSVTSIGGGAFSGCSGLTEITSEAITAPLLGQYAFEGVNPMIPVNIPCGRMLSYMSRWSYFSNFVEGAGYSFEATSDNPAMGYVTVLTQPTCSAPQAVVNAVAIPGYRFDHWSNGSTANPYSFTLSQNTSLVAYFAVAARDTVFVHDTTFVNVFVPVHDTTFIDNYIHDTTIVNNYIHDTTTVTQWQYDTTYVNVYVPVHDTTFIDNYIHDTTIVNNYIHDTAYVDVYIHDTTFVEVLVHDTITITEELNWYALSVVSGNSDRGFVAGNGRFPENTEVEIAAIPIIGSRFVQWQDGNTDNPRRVSVENDMSFVATFDVAEVGVTDVETTLYSIYAQDGRIVVENASDAQIRIFDTLGRCISTNKSKEYTRIFNMPASGVYMVQVGNTPAQKVVVVR